MAKTKQNRSKYNFGSLKEVGDERLVDPVDVHSALCALSAFNKRHGTDIVLEPDGLGVLDGKIRLVVTSI